MTTYHHILHAPRQRRRTAGVAAGARAIVAHRNPALRVRIASMLRRDGFEVAAVSDGRAVVAQLASWTVGDGRSADLVVTGAELPGRDGIDLATTLPETDWQPAMLLALDREEASAHVEGELERRVPTAFVFRAPFDDDDMRTVALFVARRGRRRRKPWRAGNPKPNPTPPKEHRMPQAPDETPRRRRVELEIDVQDAAPFDEIFDFADEQVIQLEPNVVGSAACSVRVMPSHKIPGAFEAVVELGGPEQQHRVRRRSHTAMGALRHAFGELHMRVRRPRSDVEMRAVGHTEARDGEDDSAAG